MNGTQTVTWLLEHKYKHINFERCEAQSQGNRFLKQLIHSKHVILSEAKDLFLATGDVSVAWAYCLS